MSEKSIPLTDGSSGLRIAVRDAIEKDETNSRIIPRFDFTSGKFMTPIGAAFRGAVNPITTADTFDLTALLGSLRSYLIDVGDECVLTVAVEQTVTGGMATITPILFDNQEPPQIVGILPSKLVVQPYSFRKGNSTGNYVLPTVSWDVIGAHKIGLHISEISGSGNGVTLYAWIEGAIISYSGDPWHRNVVLLAPMDGADTSTNFIDYSPLSPKTLTPNGAVQITTAQSKFGNSCAAFSGGYLSIPNSTDWNFGTGDFTIDCWVNFITAPYTTSSGAGNMTFGIWGDGVSASLGYAYNWLFMAQDSNMMSFWFSDTVKLSGTLPSGNWQTGIWYHIAVVRYRNTFTFYLDGTSIGSTDVTGKTTGSTNYNLMIGKGVYGNPDITVYLNGYIDDYRITKGVARWTTDFTPPTSANPLVEGRNSAVQDQYYWYNKLLLNMDGENNSTIIPDYAPTPKPIICVGNAKLSTAQKKFGASSLYIDGVNTSYAYAPASDDFAFGTGDFTVEVFVYLLGNNGFRITNRTASSSPGCWGLNIYPATSIGFTQVITGEPGITAAFTTELNRWYHFAASRQNGMLRVFADGIVIGQGSFTTNLSTSSYALLIGLSGPSESSLNGYIDSLRITKGIARYTSNFTPTTSAFLTS